jgi:hypothetical protein
VRGVCEGVGDLLGESGVNQEQRWCELFGKKFEY